MENLHVLKTLGKGQSARVTWRLCRLRLRAHAAEPVPARRGAGAGVRGGGEHEPGSVPQEEVPKLLPKVRPIHEFVKVDAWIPGLPVAPGHLAGFGRSSPGGGRDPFAGLELRLSRDPGGVLQFTTGCGGLWRRLLAAACELLRSHKRNTTCLVSSR